MGFKGSLVWVAGRWPATAAFGALARKRPLVLLYHGVTAKRESEGSENHRGKHVPLEDFERQMSWIAKRFAVVPLAEVEEAVISRRATAHPTCAITFDDGYLNNYLHAYPVLRRMGLPATFFVTGEFLDGRGPLWTDRLEYGINKRRTELVSVAWPEGEETYRIGSVTERVAADRAIRDRLKRLDGAAREAAIDLIASLTGADLAATRDVPEDYRPMSWAQAAEMARAGMTIGGHTATHPILSRLPPEEQAREIISGRDRVVAEVGECRHFAYPNGQPGDWDDSTVVALGAAGFRAAWTTEARRVDPTADGPFALPRLAMDSSWKGRRFEALVSDALPGIRRLTRI